MGGERSEKGGEGRGAGLTAGAEAVWWVDRQQAAGWWQMVGKRRSAVQRREMRRELSLRWMKLRVHATACDDSPLRCAVQAGAAMPPARLDCPRDDVPHGYGAGHAAVRERDVWQDLF